MVFYLAIKNFSDYERPLIFKKVFKIIWHRFQVIKAQELNILGG